MIVWTAMTVVTAKGPGRTTTHGAHGLDKGGHFFLGVAVILAVSWLGGWLTERLDQPRVIGEICAGLAMGPSLLGRFVPGLKNWLFPADILPMLDGLAQLGLVLFMFGVGRELSRLRLRDTGRQMLLVSQASMLMPFAAGAAVAVPLVDDFAGPVGKPVIFVLFVGCALSVTALPVLARILADLRLTRTSQGQLSLFVAAVGDGASWLILTALLAGAKGGSPTGVLWNGLFTIAIAAVFLGPLRSGLSRWPGLRAASGSGAGDATTMVLLAVGVAAASVLTTLVGVHQLIGAMLVGLAWPTGGGRAERVADRLSGTSKTVLLPFFFFGFGLSVDLGSLRLDQSCVLALSSFLVLGVVTKVCAPALGAVLTGMRPRAALVLGVLLNTRGLTELVIVQIGYQAGFIDQRLLAILTVVALITTILTRPLLRLLGPDAVEPATSGPEPATALGKRAPELPSLSR
ncbi:cation:proton antiporter [Streptomyces sp. NPDC051132]|uniref:cation:proton antiporter domain-containing protein n=1 Tax=unclassified Streptomyces TaxID=2593676 RepID=UPI0034482289